MGDLNHKGFNAPSAAHHRNLAYSRFHTYPCTPDLGILIADLGMWPLGESIRVSAKTYPISESYRLIGFLLGSVFRTETLDIVEGLSHQNQLCEMQ
jgi:hypothetical protein